MKQLLILLIVLICLSLLSGCAGVTEYHVTTPDGVAVDVRNTKDYQSYSLNAKKEADGSYSVRLDEQGVSASDPMSTMSDSISRLIDLIPAAAVL